MAQPPVRWASQKAQGDTPTLLQGPCHIHFAKQFFLVDQNEVQDRSSPNLFCSRLRDEIISPVEQGKIDLMPRARLNKVPSSY